MFQNIKKGDIVKTTIGPEHEAVWCEVTGFHNGEGCIQARIGTPLETIQKKVGDFIRIPQDDIFDVLKKRSPDS